MYFCNDNLNKIIVAFNIITLPVVILFIANGFGQLIYAIQLQRKFPEEHNFSNSILIFCLWILAAILYPLFYSTIDANIILFQTLSAICICIITPIILFLILFYQYLNIIKKNPDIKEKRNIEVYLNNFDKFHDEIKDVRIYDLNTDIHRKALHLIPAGIVIFLWVFAVYIWAGIWRADQLWGISGEDFGKFLILTVGFSGILVFAALDYVRLSYIFEKRNMYHFLPDIVSELLTKTIKRKEIYEFTKPAALVLAFVPIFFFPFSIFAAAALIATLGDGAASIFGMRFGNRNFPKKSKKTVIGYIAGFLVSLIVSVIALWIFEPNLLLTKIIIIALGGAIMFSVIDLLNLKVDDNILNPLFCALMMGFLYFSI
jgi:dolichol kinase